MFKDVAELLGPSGLHAQLGFQVRNDTIFRPGFFTLFVVISDKHETKIEKKNLKKKKE